MAKGVKFVKKARAWCVYNTKNQKDKTDELFWFPTKEEAEAKLVELFNSQ